MLVTFYFSNLFPKRWNCRTASTEELLFIYRGWSKGQSCSNIIPEILVIVQDSALDKIF